MTVRTRIAGAVVALAFGLWAGSAQSAPTSLSELKAGAQPSTVEQVRHHPRHHCRWVYGEWHCWWGRPYARYYYYGPGFYGPGFGIYFGPGPRWWW
jgi:hypothetical protein